MAGINFSGVEEVKSRTSTKPGTIGVFTITDVKFNSTPNKGTYYMAVTFSRDDDDFRHSFFLTEKALSRVKTLVKHAAAVELDGEVLEEKLIALLKNKQVALKVTARIDEANGRAYPDLSFGGFSKSAADVGSLSFTSKELELNANAKTINSSTPAEKPAAATAPAEEEIF